MNKTRQVEKAEANLIVELTNQLNLACMIRVLKYEYGFGKVRLERFLESYLAYLDESYDERNFTVQSFVKDTEEMTGYDIKALLSDIHLRDKSRKKSRTGAKPKHVKKKKKQQNRKKRR